MQEALTLNERALLAAASLEDLDALARWQSQRGSLFRSMNRLEEALASYPEILKEIKLGLQECGRKLGTYVRKGKRLKREFDKRNYIEKYIPHIGIALQEILDLSVKERDHTVSTLEDVLHKSRKF